MLLFGPLVIQLLWYILKQLFTSVSVKVVDIYLSASWLSKYLPLFTPAPLQWIIVNCLEAYRIIIWGFKNSEITLFTPAKFQAWEHISWWQICKTPYQVEAQLWYLVAAQMVEFSSSSQLHCITLVFKKEKKKMIIMLMTSRNLLIVQKPKFHKESF